MYSKIFKNFNRVIVTGGSGFIGSNLISRLLKITDCEIYNIDKMGYASDETLIKKSICRENKNRYKLINIDLVNEKDINVVVNEIKPDLVMHLAAESHVDRSIDGPKDFIESNIVGTFNLLQSCLSYYKSSLHDENNFRFHHISTDEVFGSLGNEGAFNEETPYAPSSPYSSSKAASDHLVRAWNETYKLPTVITNCSNNFGPYQFPEKLIPVAILNLVRGEKVPIYGDGENIRDWLYVGDHVNALLQVAEKGRISETYCIGGYGEMTNKNIVFEICKIMDKIFVDNAPHSKLIYFVEDRPGHDRRYAIDPKKLKNELGWEVEKTFSMNLELTVRWYLKNIDWCKKVLKNQSLNRRGLIK
tara:strand:+ start:1268 stop:2347 length:1080 start_codon:yes stop_codon:yes gene_type:complete